MLLRSIFTYLSEHNWSRLRVISVRRNSLIVFFLPFLDVSVVDKPRTIYIYICMLFVLRTSGGLSADNVRRVLKNTFSDTTGDVSIAARVFVVYSFVGVRVVWRACAQQNGSRFHYWRARSETETGSPPAVARKRPNWPRESAAGRATDVHEAASFSVRRTTARSPVTSPLHHGRRHRSAGNGLDRPVLRRDTAAADRWVDRCLFHRRRPPSAFRSSASTDIASKRPTALFRLHAYDGGRRPTAKLVAYPNVVNVRFSKRVYDGGFLLFRFSVDDNVFGVYFESYKRFSIRSYQRRKRRPYITLLHDYD